MHVVSKRLGHARVEITLNTYAQVVPDMQTQAAATIGALLHGERTVYSPLSRGVRAAVCKRP